VHYSHNTTNITNSVLLGRRILKSWSSFRRFPRKKFYVEVFPRFFTISSFPPLDVGYYNKMGYTGYHKIWYKSYAVVTKRYLEGEPIKFLYIRKNKTVNTVLKFSEINVETIERKLKDKLVLGEVYTVFIKVRYNVDNFFMVGNQYSGYLPLSPDTNDLRAWFDIHSTPSKLAQSTLSNFPAPALKVVNTPRSLSLPIIKKLTVFIVFLILLLIYNTI